MKEKFYWQERPWTCGAAALRIAAFNLGIRRKEEYFVKKLKTTIKSGTKNKSFIKVVRSFKLDYKYGKGSIGLLRKLKSEGYEIIVNYFSVIQNTGHYAVVKKITRKDIFLDDPALGPNKKYHLTYFRKTWYSQVDKDKKLFLAIKKK